MINTTISAIIQVVVFALIPFIVYLVKSKKVKGFLNYVGLKKSTAKANMLALLVALLIALPVLTLTFVNKDFMEIMTSPKSISGGIRQMGAGFDAVYTILIIALIKTALSEEILFRGFLAKRLIAWLGFTTGNVVQAVIFGAIHTLLFMSISANAFFLIVIFFFPALGAYFKTYINEKIANGSIVPGWIAHGFGNIISYSIITFFA